MAGCGIWKAYFGPSTMATLKKTSLRKWIGIRKEGAQIQKEKGKFTVMCSVLHKTLNLRRMTTKCAKTYNGRAELMGAFLWYDLDQDQWSKIIWIMVHERNRSRVNSLVPWGENIMQRLELPTARHRPRQTLTRNCCRFAAINKTTVPGAASGRCH